MKYDKSNGGDFIHRKCPNLTLAFFIGIASRSLELLFWHRNTIHFSKAHTLETFSLMSTGPFSHAIGKHHKLAPSGLEAGGQTERAKRKVNVLSWNNDLRAPQRPSAHCTFSLVLTMVLILGVNELNISTGLFYFILKDSPRPLLLSPPPPRLQVSHTQSTNPAF